MALKRSSLENYVLLLVHVESMRTTTFNAKTFLKKIRPFCKTEQLAHKILHIRVRGSKVGISIHIEKDCFIIRQNQALHEFIFYCDSCKTLLKKLLKHNLLTP
ncbi:hypothetical protein DCO46_16875 [Flavobacterium sp. HTF]|nr:hypothetical protein DCO46_16875 [Flavobacterium sp. HTF]